jgi:transcriptional regulator GlxA family with amidase domain
MFSLAQDLRFIFVSLSFGGTAMARPSTRGHTGPFEFNPAGLTTSLVCQRKSAKDPRIQRALDLLQQNHAPQSDDLAMTLNLSPSRFRHLFKEELGISPHHYLMNARLHRARALLENSFLRVKEVAALVGVNDLSHFVRDYKMLFNETPTQTRTRSRRFRSAPS